MNRECGDFECPFCDKESEDMPSCHWDEITKRFLGKVEAGIPEDDPSSARTGIIAGGAIRKPDLGADSLDTVELEMENKKKSGFEDGQMPLSRREPKRGLVNIKREKQLNAEIAVLHEVLFDTEGEVRPDVAKAIFQRRKLLRTVNRCQLCGRSRGYYRKFGLCRICFRKLAEQGQIPGVKKSSW